MDIGGSGGVCTCSTSGPCHDATVSWARSRICPGSPRCSILADGKIIVAAGRNAALDNGLSTEVLATGIPPLHQGPAQLQDAAPPRSWPRSPIAPPCRPPRWPFTSRAGSPPPSWWRPTPSGPMRLAAPSSGRPAMKPSAPPVLRRTTPGRPPEPSGPMPGRSSMPRAPGQTPQTKRAAAETVRDQRLKQFHAKADTEDAELLPDVEKVRADKAEAAASLATSRKRRSDRRGLDQQAASARSTARRPSVRGLLGPAPGHRAL